MKHLLSKFLIALTAGAPVCSMAQEPVSVGKGSYAAYTPLYKCRTDEHGGDQSRTMQTRKLYVHERTGQSIPTNDWWTNLITEQYSGHLWSYPQFIQAQNYGVDVQWPSYWIDNGTEMKSLSVLKVTGDDFHPESAVAESWHDWDVEFSMADGDKKMSVTMAHGTPFTWIEIENFSPVIQAGSNAAFLDANGKTLSGTVSANRFIVKIGDDLYGVYLPDNSEVSVGNGKAEISELADHKFVVVALLHDAAQLNAFADYAYRVPRETTVNWSYNGMGKVKTVWHVRAEDLRTGSDATDVMQGFLPHHYRNGASAAFSFADASFRTPHGMLKMATGNDFEVDYDFHGMLPWYAAPTDTDRDKHPFLTDRMLQMIQTYASTAGFGADTYWGGKSLTQMALNMMFAREMGNEELFRACHDKLKEAMVNWLTYTPGEDAYFFARYDRWGGLVGYNTSYDSDTFNDHHFHYGYFTLAGALLAMVDDDFRDNYGPMLKLVAKDYANWDRTDNRFPLFRTFDPWAGHSFAGGMGDGYGNGQESSSEAMQGWGGVYLLGVVLGDDAMRDAGLFGWVSEARGTAEYWFDRHGDKIDPAMFHQGNDENYNIDYTKFTDDKGSDIAAESNTPSDIDLANCKIWLEATEDSVAYAVEATATTDVVKTDISSVEVTGIDTPVSNTALDTSAVCATQGVSTTAPAVTWTPNDINAGYNTIYTASVTLAASANYEFTDSVIVTINGNNANVTKNEDGTLTVIYTFPATAKDKLTSITVPGTVTVANGTAYKDMNLPTQVNIVTEGNTVDKADVTWDTASGNYDPSVLTEQVVTLNGTVTCPENIDASFFS